MTPHLIVFAKPPRIGLSKTRLARSLGKAEARRIAAFLAARTLRRACDPRWTTELRMTPDPARLALRLARRFETRAQGGGDLGDRLARAFSEAPKGPVIVIGTDAPDLSRTLIWRGFRALRHHDAVIGPAKDGGFWLFGLSGAYRGPLPFHPVRWSTAETLSDLRANLPAQTRLATQPALADIDEAEDWRAWRKRRSPQKQS